MYELAGGRPFTSWTLTSREMIVSYFRVFLVFSHHSSQLCRNTGRNIESFHDQGGHFTRDIIVVF